MAQNITLQGASYSSVPSILLPKTGGGTASFVDVTGTTAIASDVASGKLFFNALGVLTTGTASGGGGTGLVYETGTYTTNTDVARPTVSFASTHATVPIFIGMEDATGTTPSQNSIVVFAFFNAARYTGVEYPYNVSPQTRSAVAVYGYMGSSTASVSGTLIRYPDTNSLSSTTAYVRYWATESAFYPNAANTSRYWRANRTYKWIAVWK